jgi:predicted transposase/invertase (TIGR01784 family)
MGAHDLHFRKIFSDPVMFGQMLQIYLPEDDIKRDLKLGTLRLRKLNASFIRNMVILNYGEKAAQDKQLFEQLKEEIADLVFTCERYSSGEAVIIPHFEHQSTPDLTMSLRCALYDLSALKDYVDEVKPAKYPLVLSFVFYHGKPSPYPYPTDIKEMFANRELADKYFLKPILVDYGQKSDQELLAHGDVASTELAFKHQADNKIKSETIKNIMRSFSNCTKLSLVHENYRYILSTWETSVESLNAEYLKTMGHDKEFIMTAMQQYEEKILKQHAPMLKAEGKAEGAREKAIATARNMLLRGLDAQLVVECTNLSKEEVKALTEEVKASRH